MGCKDDGGRSKDDKLILALFGRVDVCLARVWALTLFMFTLVGDENLVAAVTGVI